MTWHNQVVQLAQSFQAFGSIVGGAIVNAMKPFIRALNAGMQAAISFAKVVSDALGFIFGWKYEEGGGGISELPEVFDDAAGGAGDMAGGTGKAADNAKKLKSYLMGIDELNVLEPPKDDSGGGGGGGGGANASGADGGQWVKGESGLQSYMSSIDSLFKLGDTIASKLADALGDINWNKVYARAVDFGTGLAHFLNGLIKPELFAELGTTIANSINTALYALNSFGKTFNWHNFGVSISEGLNAFFRSFKPQLAANTFNTFVLGILETISTAIRMTNWWQVGNTIGQMIAGIDWIGILSSVKDVVGGAITAMFTAAAGMFDASPGFAIIATTLATGFAALKTAQAIQGFASFITGIKDTIIGLGKTIEGAFGVGSIPIVGAVAGLGLLITYLEASSSAAANHSAYGEYARTLEGLSNQIDRNNESINSSITYMRKHVGEAGTAELALARDLAEEYGRLSEKLNPTVTEQLRMKDISQQLVGIFPELKEHINEENGLLSIQKGELDELINKTDAYYRLQAGREVLLNAYKAQIEAEQNLKIAQEGANVAIEDYLKTAGLTDAAIHQLLTREKSHWQLMEEANKSPIDFEKLYGVKTLNELEKSYALVDEAQQKYNSSVEEAQSTYEKATENLNYIKEAVNGYADEVNSIEYVEMVAKTSQAVDALGGIWSGGKQVLGQEAINIYNEIQAGLNPDENGYYTLGNGQIVQFGQGMADAAPDAVSTLDEALLQQVNSVLEPQGKILLKKDGEYIVQGLADSIDANKSKVEAPMKGLGDLLKSTYENEVEINSPSRVFWRYGEQTVQGLADGISENQGLVENPIKTWVKSIFTWFTGDGSGDDKINASAFGNIAKQIIPGFGSGISEGQGQSQSPIEGWANSIIQWFTKGEADGGINVTTFTNFAKKVVEGFGGGVTSNSSSNQSTLETWGNNIKTWFWGSGEGPKSGLAKKFEDFGRWMVEGLVNGIKSMWDTASEWMGKLSDKMADVTKKKNEIGSPSKLYYQFGEWIVEGFANGINDSANLAKQAVVGMSDGAQDGMKNVAAQVGNAKLTASAAQDGIIGALSTTVSAQNVAAATSAIPTGVKNSWDSTRVQWSHDMEHWWAFNVTPYFEYGRWQTTTSTIQTSIAFNLKAMMEEWRKNINSWWDTLVVPYFTKERWNEQSQRIYDSIITAQNKMVSEWAKKIKSWWDSGVAPYFTRERWDGITVNISDSIKSAFETAVDESMDILEDFFGEVSDMIEELREELKSISDSVERGDFDAEVDVDWERDLDSDHWGSDDAGHGPGIGLASGGTVKSGQWFVARENGIPEMVGKFGNQAGVANNFQIVSGIAAGVSSALSGLVASINGLANREVYMPSFAGVSYGTYGGAVGMTDGERNAYAQQLAQAIVVAQNSGDDNRLMREQNDLLSELLDKDSNIYIDGRELNKQTATVRRRAGYAFRPQTV